MSLIGKKFKLWREYGALNAKPVFDAFSQSLADTDCDIIRTTNLNDADVHVIWSVLWHGRMARNKQIWDHCQQTNKPVIVLEVGGISRGTTWKVGLNGVNRDAYFGPVGNGGDRSVSLGLQVKPWKTDGEYILICGQHDRSLQWQNQPSMNNWFLETYDTIRKYSNRPIIFRPHPRCRLPDIEQGLKSVYRQEPQKIDGTYDDFGIDFDKVWATINWSSNPSVHSIINGVPAVVGPSSLAWPVAEHDLANIENPTMPDRTQWLNDYAWTEYTLEEIRQGIPLKRLTSRLL